MTSTGDQEIGVVSERVGMCEIDDDQILWHNFFWSPVAKPRTFLLNNYASLLNWQKKKKETKKQMATKAFSLI